MQNNKNLRNQKVSLPDLKSGLNIENQRQRNLSSINLELGN